MNVPYFLKKLWEQNLLCPISQHRIEIYGIMQMSPERIDESIKKYTDKNMCLIGAGFQTCSHGNDVNNIFCESSQHQMNRERYQNFKTLVNTYDTDRFNYYVNELQKIRPKKIPCKRKPPNEMGELECSHCNTYQPPENFSSQRYSCKKCDHNFRNTPFGFIKQILNHSKRRHKVKHNRRIKNGLKGFQKDFNLDYDFIVNLLIKNQGKCYYSDIQYYLKTGPLQVSFERLDNNKGYIKSNVQLIVYELNTKAQWSQENFKKYFLKLMKS